MNAEAGFNREREPVRRVSPGCSPPEQNLTVTGRFIDVGDGKLYAHVRTGVGPALVFVHYWGGSHRTWTPVIQRIRALHPVVAYDQRGWGASATVPGPYGLNQLADDALRVIEKCGLDSYVLVGHSMGGKASQVLAARRPRGLVGVVLVAPAPPMPVDISLEQRETFAHAYDNVDSVNRAIDGALTKSGLDPSFRSQVVEDSLVGRGEVLSTWPKEALAQDISDAVSAIDVPVLVLAGSHDEVDTPENLESNLLPYIRTAVMRRLIDTGHLSPLEVPDQIAAHLEEFMTKIDR